jgi:hypothetical protein|tara:strand:- start:1593 stop:1811 length:219 start_codon:yes stop_codon:yes gene_type:complete
MDIAAPALGRYMMDLTYKTGSNYELANVLSRLGEDLVEMDTPFAKRWKEYTPIEKRIIHNCIETMKLEKVDK